MILGVDFLEIDVLAFFVGAHQLYAGGAGGGGHRLAIQLRQALDARCLLDRHAYVGDEGGRRKGHLLLPRFIVGGGAAFEVDRAVGHQRNAVLRGHRRMRDLERRKFQLRLDGIDDPVADVDVIADRLLLVVEIGERQRRFTNAQGDAGAVLDFLQRAARVLGQDRQGKGRQDDGSGKCDATNHGGLLKLLFRLRSYLPAAARPTSASIGRRDRAAPDGRRARRCARHRGPGSRRRSSRSTGDGR